MNSQSIPLFLPGEAPAERVGVYVCHCGSNIAATVDVAEVRDWAGQRLEDSGVVVSRDYKFMCSSLGKELFEQDIKELGLTRVVVATCTPHLHEGTFRGASKRAGLNPYLCELVSIREQVSWVHTDRHAATDKAKAVVSGGVERVIRNTLLEPLHVPIHPATLVVGGGADGVLITGCHPGECHYIEQNYKALRRYLLLRRTVSAMGIEPERIKLVWASAAEGVKLAHEFNSFVVEVRALGPLHWPQWKGAGAAEAEKMEVAG
jgi:coenzyme F420-reducing hydrogenase delta subunit